MARDGSSTGTGSAFRSAAVVVGLGTLLALVVGLLAGYLQGDVAAGLATWASPVVAASAVVGVVVAHRAGERRR